MSSGLTAPVAEGKNTFGQFFWRAMGGRPKFDEDDRSDLLESAKRHEAEADALRAMSDADLEIFVKEKQREYREFWTAVRDKKNRQRANYESMIAECEAQALPKGCEKIKSDLVAELKRSLEFDCSGSDDTEGSWYNDPQKWRAEQLVLLSDWAARDRKRYEEHKEETKEQHAHWRALLEAVPYEEPPP